MQYVGLGGGEPVSTVDFERMPVDLSTTSRLVAESRQELSAATEKTLEQVWAQHKTLIVEHCFEEFERGEPPPPTHRHHRRRRHHHPPPRRRARPVGARGGDGGGDRVRRADRGVALLQRDRQGRLAPGVPGRRGDAPRQRPQAQGAPPHPA